MIPSVRRLLSMRSGKIVSAFLVALVGATLPIAAALCQEPDSGPYSRNHTDYPNVPETWCGLHVLRKEYFEAIEDCNEAAVQNPQDPTIYSNRGAAYMMLSEIDLALADVDLAIKLDPTDTAAHYNRGFLHIRKGLYPEALAAYTEALRLQPHHPFALYNRGFVLETLGRHQEAIADYRNALALLPGLLPARQALKRLGAE